MENLDNLSQIEIDREELIKAYRDQYGELVLNVENSILYMNIVNENPIFEIKMEVNQ